MEFIVIPWRYWELYTHWNNLAFKVHQQSHEMYFLLKCILVIASVKLSSEEAQVDARRYVSE